jgi:hypothetical protein
MPGLPAVDRCRRHNHMELRRSCRNPAPLNRTWGGSKVVRPGGTSRSSAKTTPVSAGFYAMSDKRFFLAVAVGVLLAIVVTWIGMTYGLN